MNDLGIMCFLSLSRTKNLVTTSSQLNITKPAVLSNIRRLEGELETPLFQAELPGFAHTTAGKLFFEFFSGLEKDLSNSMQVFSRPGDKRRLIVGWSEWEGCPDEYMRAIRRYSEENEQVTVFARQASPENILRMMTDGSVDVALISGYMTHGVKAAFHKTVLTELPLYLVTSADGAFADLTMEEFVRYPFPHFSCMAGEDDDRSACRRVDMEYMRLGYAPRFSYMLPNWDSVYLCVRMDDCLTVAPKNNKLRAAADRFVFRRMPRTVTLTACRLQSAENEDTARFVRYLQGVDAEDMP